MDKRHDDWDRCAPAVGGALAFLVPLAVLSKMEHTLSMSLGCLVVQAVKQTTITKGTQNARVLIALHRFEAKRQAALADPSMRRAQAQAHRVLSPS